MLKIKGLLAAIFACAMSFGVAHGYDIQGAGATFPRELYTRWAIEYAKISDTRLGYQAIGSSAGVGQLKRGLFDFAATDIPLTADQLERKGLSQSPVATGGVVPIINLDGVGPGRLVLDGRTLARIFMGDIKKWNDPAIEKLNPGLALPVQWIAPVHRSDGSGTTSIFTNYLSEQLPEWKSRIGANGLVQWPVGIGAKGNDGVASSVQRTKGSIGYVEFGYATGGRLAHVNLINKQGKEVAPSLAAFRAATANAQWDRAKGFRVILTDQPGDESWPIVGATFILIPKLAADAAKAATTIEFFAWALNRGGKLAESLNYVPLPAHVAAAVQDAWAMDVRDERGIAVFQIGKAKPRQQPAPPPQCGIFSAFCRPLN